MGFTTDNLFGSVLGPQAPGTAARPGLTELLLRTVGPLSRDAANPIARGLGAFGGVLGRQIGAERIDPATIRAGIAQPALEAAQGVRVNQNPALAPGSPFPDRQALLASLAERGAPALSGGLQQQEPLSRKPRTAFEFFQSASPETAGLVDAAQALKVPILNRVIPPQPEAFKGGSGTAFGTIDPVTQQVTIQGRVPGRPITRQQTVTNAQGEIRNQLSLTDPFTLETRTKDLGKAPVKQETKFLPVKGKPGVEGLFKIAKGPKGETLDITEIEGFRRPRSTRQKGGLFADLPTSAQLDAFDVFFSSAKLDPQGRPIINPETELPEIDIPTLRENMRRIKNREAIGFVNRYAQALTNRDLGVATRVDEATIRNFNKVVEGVRNIEQARGGGRVTGRAKARADPEVIAAETNFARAVAEGKTSGTPLPPTVQTAVGALSFGVETARRLRSEFTPEERASFSGFLQFPARKILQIVAEDPKFATFQTLINMAKGQAFGEGGKQLTPFEASIVFGYVPTGTEFSTADFEAKLLEAEKRGQFLINRKLRLATTPRGRIKPEDFTQGAAREMVIRNTTTGKEMIGPVGPVPRGWEKVR